MELHLHYRRYVYAVLSRLRFLLTEVSPQCTAPRTFSASVATTLFLSSKILMASLIVVALAIVGSARYSILAIRWALGPTPFLLD